MALAAPPATEFALIATALDADFYRQVHTDVAEAGVDPVQHYVMAGWREGRDPAPWFSTDAYLAANPDVAALGLNPFVHYLETGAREGRAAEPSTAASIHLRRTAKQGWRSWTYEAPQGPTAVTPPPAVEAAPAPQAPAARPTAEVRRAIEGEFDARFYLGENPDVADSDVDPLTHFLEAGWREGRNPTPWFSVADYLELSPDVAAAGLNPFAHYVQAGRAEGRAPRLELGFRHAIIAKLPSLEDRIRAASRYDRPVTAGDADELRAALDQGRSGFERFHLSVSHDDFTSNLGGVQLCLQREAAAAAQEGFDHLNLFPFNPRAMLRSQAEVEPIGLVWNGKPIGAFDAQTIASVLGEKLATNPVKTPSLAIHSLLGHRVSDVLAIISAAGMKHGWFWVHDFAAACISYHLLRNDVVDCGAPPPESQACHLCVYGEARAFHRAEHRRLFDALDLRVAAPSQVALDTWLRGSAVTPRTTVVAPLARLVPRSEKPKPSRRGGPFRLAYPGLPGTLKGWPIFRELVLRFADDPRYQFLHLARDPSGLPAEFHPVTVTAENSQMMRETIEAQNVDAVLIWSLCRETFSFTTHEAAAAGAAILTGPDSGNVAAFVRSSGEGQVLPDEKALYDLFETGAVLELARHRRGATPSDLVFSRLTFDLPTETQP